MEDNMKELGERIKADVAEIVELWDEVVTGSPWRSLPKEHRIDDIPQAVEGLVNLALCAPDDRDAHRAAIWASVKHGEHRRKHGFTESVLFVEYHYLRQAIWEFIQRHERQGDRMTEAIMRIDTAVTLATQAMLRGYHREEIEEQGRWPGFVEQLVETSPFLPGRPRSPHDPPDPGNATS